VIAAEFQPSVTAAFNDAKLALSILTPPNQVSVYLETDNSGSPGTIIEGPINVTGLTTLGSVITANSALYPLLQSGTNYWLVAYAANANTCAGWFDTLTGPFTNTELNHTSSPTGGPWSPIGDTPAFQIDGVSIGPNAALDPGAQMRYVANLNIGDSYIDITNTGVQGNTPLGPGVGTTGNLCVNVYAFDPNEELVSCCSCLVTPDQTVSLSANTNINAHSTEAGLTSLTIKLIAVNPLVVSASNPSLTNCTNSAAGFVNVTVGGAVITTPTATLATGVAAWGTTVHSGPTAGIFSETETPFTPFTLSASEAVSIFGRCAAIIGNLSGNGICSSCKAGSITSSGLGTGVQLPQ
jgi:hypothetical protein